MLESSLCFFLIFYSTSRLQFQHYLWMSFSRGWVVEGWVGHKIRVIFTQRRAELHNNNKGKNTRYNDLYDIPRCRVKGDFFPSGRWISIKEVPSFRMRNIFKWAHRSFVFTCILSLKHTQNQGENLLKTYSHFKWWNVSSFSLFSPKNRLVHFHSSAHDLQSSTKLYDTQITQNTYIYYILWKIRKIITRTSLFREALLPMHEPTILRGDRTTTESFCCVLLHPKSRLFQHWKFSLCNILSLISNIGEREFR